MPEKVLGTTEAWANRHPNTLLALVKALIEACLWLDEPSNRGRGGAHPVEPRYLNTPAEVMSRTPGTAGLPRLPARRRELPWRSHADWFLAQMVRWKQASPDIDIKGTADRVYRTDIYRAAAREMGVDCPDVDRLPAGPATANPSFRNPARGRRPGRRRAVPIEDFLGAFYVQETMMKTTKIGRRPSGGRHRHRPLMSAVRASFPVGRVRPGSRPETNKVTLGFIALTDASPLIIAKERSFDKYGITDANIAKQASWGTTRDNIVLGLAPAASTARTS